MASGQARMPQSEGQEEGPVFGLSISKLLFTVLVVIAVWKGFAMVGRLARQRQRAEVLRRRPANRPAAASRQTIELVECPRCGAYFDPREGCRCEHGAA